MKSTAVISMGLALAVGLGATGAEALTPPLPCLNEIEDGMGVDNVMTFGHSDSGFTVEDYTFVGSQTSASLPAALTKFYGGRVVECRSGKIVAVNYQRGEAIQQSLSATEFLRAAVQGERRIRFNDVQRAAKAVFGEDVMVLRETEETCGCNYYFPSLRPKSLAPYQQD